MNTPSARVGFLSLLVGLFGCGTSGDGPRPGADAASAASDAGAAGHVTQDLDFFSVHSYGTCTTQVCTGGKCESAAAASSSVVALAGMAAGKRYAAVTNDTDAASTLTVRMSGGHAPSYSWS
jgi:hypothetical protein